MAPKKTQTPGETQTSTSTRDLSPVSHTPLSTEASIARVLMALTQQIQQMNQAPQIRSVKKLPTFKGRIEECPVRFIQKCEETLTEQGTTEEEFTDLVLPQLLETAATWSTPMKTLSLSWEAFSKALIGEFNGIAAQTKIRTTFFGKSQQPRETAVTFSRQKAAIWQRMSTMQGNVDEPTAVHTTVELLQAEFRRHLRTTKFNSFEELVEVVTLLDQDITTSVTSGNFATTTPWCKNCNASHLYKDCPKLRQINSNRASSTQQNNAPSNNHNNNQNPNGNYHTNRNSNTSHSGNATQTGGASQSKN